MNTTTRRAPGTALAMVRHPATTRTGVMTGLLLVTAVAHVPATRHHAAESHVLGVTFAAFTVACVALALALALRPAPAAYAAAALLCASAVAAYAVTRSYAVPGFEHDVGLWLDPLGVVSVAAETVVALLALRPLRA